MPQSAPTSASTGAQYTGPLAAAKFTITIPGLKSAGATARRPAYISASTASVSIWLNNPPIGFTQPGTFALTAGSLNVASNVDCPAIGSGYACTIPIMIPPGSDSLTLTTRDALGNVLSQQIATFVITAGQNNTPSTILDANSRSITVTPPGTGVLVWGRGCTRGTIFGSNDLSATCTANFGNSIAPKSLTVSVADTRGTTIPSSDPGAPVLSARSSDAAYMTSLFGSTLTITPGIGGTATITVTASPANSSGPFPGDGLSPVVLAFTVTQYPTGTVTEFTGGYNGQGIALGPDGNLWFATNGGNAIARITPTGTMTTFATSSPTWGVTLGPDGNMWFTEDVGNRIGRVTPAGIVTEFSAGITANSSPEGITTGPDGNLWFTEYLGDKIGRITPTGTVTEFTVAAGAKPQGITSGPDGNLWFTATGGIMRITPGGVATIFGITAHAASITAGPDGNLWFTEDAVDRIGRITPAGSVTTFSTGITTGSQPYGITNGPDGNLWFTEYGARRIGRITPAGTVTEFTAGLTSGQWGITTGPDGNLWFTEFTGLGIGRITP